VHPAFFGSLAITCAEEHVHPAMAAYAAEQLRREEEERASGEMFAARIRALEEEKMFVMRAAEELYRQTVEEGRGSIVPEADVGRSDEAGELGERVAEVEQDEEAKRARSRREKEARRAEIMAQIKAIEEAAELDTFGGKEGEADERTASTGASGVVLRY
jgi:hypothetical protein